LSKACYSGPANTKGVGSCQAGTSICQNGAYGSCTGEVTPQKEICNNKKDDDCNGLVDEQNGRAIKLSGGSDQISVPNHAPLGLGGSFTMELWFKFDGLGSRPIALVLNKHKALENNNGYHLKIQKENNIPTLGFSWWNSNGGNQVLFGACPIGVWTHIAFVYDHTSKQYRIYLNGQAVSGASGSNTIVPGTNVHPLLFGAETPPSQTTPTDVKFRGEFGPVRLSNNARYSANFTPACTWKSDASTTGLWNLDDGGGTVLQDASSAAKNATLTGGTWSTGRSCNAAQNGGCTP
jgi:hypothetical protein